MASLRTLPAAVLAAGLVLVPATAQAHDELTGSEPSDGATGEAPDDLTLTFSGNIAEVGAAVTVTSPDGSSVTDGEPQVDGTEVEQDLADDLTDGEYAVAWRVTSEDGHPISGEFGFTVEGAAAQTSEETSEEAQPEESSEAPQESEAEPAPTPEETQGAEEETTEEETTDDSGQTSEESVSTATGVPGWAWVVVGVAVAGLLGTLAWTWQRGRS
ncbi:Copper resistance protein CopC [Serinicoccus hydrothermalis]|uniref:Copper resistance protein CopC n=1 Tax=Serinicoccus hydrothermalis TaxID=1758689 RepID=A0A1B1NER0_9MICO|nr:copper resistance CopC family protein [Serinicoccus hydrothermalis]ANS79924.1 Copper resistance protein CopC [Serinicoccus hydrothermalis]